MNLADAIRKALAEAPKPPDGPPHDESVEHDHEEPVMVHRHDEPQQPPPQALQEGSFARLELFLSPEQMASVLKVAFIYHRSVMSLREAAAYLRCTPHALEELAASGEIPAFMIDGVWRFPKNAIDEWFAMRAAAEQEKRKHVA